MRFNSGYALTDREGERRVVRKFLLCPRCFEYDKQWRWLEYADILEEVKHDGYTWKWVEIGFAPTHEKEGEF